ncbi:MAG TPA: STAS domain-containing protein [Polyangium sp.]|nr:STAS domain-containing protein [Polyangium sp.]
MQDASETKNPRLDALLDEIAQLRMANAERAQEMSCLKALQLLIPRKEMLLDDQLQEMVDLVPRGFLAPKEVSAQVRLFEYVFSTPGFRNSRESHSTIVFWDEQEIGELLVQVTGQTSENLPLPLEKQRFLSIVAERFGEWIRHWGTIGEAELSGQRLTELEALCKEVEDTREQLRRLQKAMGEYSSPIAEIWDGVLFMPRGKVLELERAWMWTEGACTTVFDKEAYFLIIDVSALDGSQLDDDYWVDGLLRVVSGVRLLGATAMFTGIQPHVARRIVARNVHLDSVLVYGSLRAGLLECIRRMKIIRRREKLRRRIESTPGTAVTKQASVVRANRPR